ncbi:MAG: response regulator transcription factor [Actinomycetota bacterium]
MTDTVRIVVAEGISSRKGFLRFVLEGEGYEVAGEASNPAELARSVSVHAPDVVVMDDGIGATSVGMVRDLAPAAKVILVWPGAVMPIGGDARVEPSNVLRELGLAVESLTGVACATSLAGGGLAGARDAVTLREVLARGEAAQLHRPGESAATEETEGEDHAAAGAAAAVGTVAAGAVVVSGGVAAAGSGPEAVSGAVAAVPPGPDAAATALNRKLGTIALSGAAAAGALVLALALGGSRVPVASISGAAAEPSSPGIGQPSISPVVPGGEGTGDVPGGWQSGGQGGGGGTQSRGGNEPLCNYYVETCLPPAGLTGTGGLSVGDVYAAVDAGAAGMPKNKRDPNHERTQRSKSDKRKWEKGTTDKARGRDAKSDKAKHHKDHHDRDGEAA